MAITVTSPKRGRPRQTVRTKAVEVEWTATAGAEVRKFTRKPDALQWLAERGNVKPIDLSVYRYLVRAYELASDDDQGIHWRRFEIRGRDPSAIEERADERVRKSVRRHALQLAGDESLSAQVPPSVADELERVVDNWYEGLERSDTPTVRKIVEDYMSAQVASDRMKEGTRDSRRSCLDAWIDREFEFNGSIRNLSRTKIADVDQELAEAWIGMVASAPNRYKAKNAPATVKRVLGLFRVAWDELRWRAKTKEIHGQLDFSAFHRLMPRERSAAELEDAAQVARERFTNEQVKQLMEASVSDPFDRALLALVLTGCRSPGEPAGARWKDIHHEHGVTWFDPTHFADKVGQEGDKRIEVTPRTKTREHDVRTLPLAAWQVDALKAVRGPGKFILGEDDSPADPEALQRQFDAIMRRAGVSGKGLSINSGRYTVLTEARLTPDGERRSRLLGHAKPGHDMIAKHYDRAAKSDHRKLLMEPDGRSVMDLMPWWR